MKQLSIILYLFICLNIKAQLSEKILYNEENNNYRFFIDKTTKIYKQNFNGSLVETFVFEKEGQFKFSLTISRSEIKNLTNDSLKTSNYEQIFKNNCNCQIVSTNYLEIKKIHSMRFKIKRIEKGKVLLGLIDNFVENKNLFTILFLTLENNFLTYQKEYFDIINTLSLSVSSKAEPPKLGGKF